MTTASPFAIEPTAIGPQSLVPGVVPIMPADRLALRAAAPLRAKKEQRPLDIGLFDMAARDQLDMFNQLPTASNQGGGG